MRQLVGSLCVICRERIQDVFEGRICDGCHNAVHNRCGQAATVQSGDERCPSCGVDLNQARELKRTEEQERRVRSAPKGSYPVSNVCPKCGNAEFKKRKPDKWIAFTADRVCTACQTRYTPPTPTWAGVVFIFVGLFLTGVGFVGVLVQLLRPDGASLVGSICEGFIGVIGVLAILHGVRSLIKPGKV